MGDTFQSIAVLKKMGPLHFEEDETQTEHFVTGMSFSMSGKN